MSGNKAGYTANKQSLAGGQGQYTEGQGQSISGQGLYFGWLCSEITNAVNFAASEIRVTDIPTDRPRDTPFYRVG